MPPATSKIAPTQSVADWAAPDGPGRHLLDRLHPVFVGLFAHLPHLAIAVSGGSDSTALMHLVWAWRLEMLAKPSSGSVPTLSVVTVDHGLRPGSAVEARAVARAAAALGLPHRTLQWQGPKPTSGIQAAARVARLDLMRSHLADQQPPAVAMAHTEDDQAETVLMRLSRGSGIDGLGAMRPLSHRADGLIVLRPLLAISKPVLVDFLRAARLRWLEDPSNQSPTFERVRLRQAQATLASLGVPLDNAALARTAARATRASDALNDVTAGIWERRGQDARLGDDGAAWIRRDWLLAHPEEIRLRLLAGLLEAVGGHVEPVSLGQLEALTIQRHWVPQRGATLHGVHIAWLPDAAGGAGWLKLIREWRRVQDGDIRLEPGETILWDGRFRLSLHPSAPGAVSVGPLGTAAKRILNDLDITRPTAATAVLRTQPVIRSEHRIVSLPTLRYEVAPFIGLIDVRQVQPRFNRPGFNRPCFNGQSRTA